MGPKPHAKNPSIAHAKNTTTSPPSITPRQLRPVITASLIADTFIEFTQTLWDGACWFGYEPCSKKWHRCDDTYCTGWERPEWADPDHVDASLDVVRELRNIIRPMIDTATTADQKRLGSFRFIADCLRFLDIPRNAACAPATRRTWRLCAQAPESKPRTKPK